MNTAIEYSKERVLREPVTQPSAAIEAPTPQNVSETATAKPASKTQAATHSTQDDPVDNDFLYLFEGNNFENGDFSASDAAMFDIDIDIKDVFDFDYLDISNDDEFVISSGPAPQKAPPTLLASDEEDISDEGFDLLDSEGDLEEFDLDDLDLVDQKPTAHS